MTEGNGGRANGWGINLGMVITVASTTLSLGLAAMFAYAISRTHLEDNQESLSKRTDQVEARADATNKKIDDNKLRVLDKMEATNKAITELSTRVTRMEGSIDGAVGELKRATGQK